MTTYLVNNWKARLLLRGVDALLSPSPLPHARPIHKVLICNGAHLGDVVLSTAILPILRAHHPQLHISFLCGSWAKGLLEDHVDVDTLHVLDHWKLNRSSQGSLEKMMAYHFQKRALQKELQEEQYDLAIDLYPFFPNAIPLLHRAKIPLRVGYTSGGWGKWLTCPVSWEKKEQNIAHYFKDLMIRSGLISSIDSSSLKPHLVYREPLSIPVQLPASYTVFHIGAGDVKKEWHWQKWRALLERFSSKGRLVVFTGQGAEQKRQIKKITDGVNSAIDLCDQLSLKTFVAVIQNASSLVSVDSVAGHIASAFSIPTTLLCSGINDMLLWKPLNPHCNVISNKPSCFPCLKKGGCNTMSCIQDIEIEEICRAAAL